MISEAAVNDLARDIFKLAGGSYQDARRIARQRLTERLALNRTPQQIQNQPTQQQQQPVTLAEAFQRQDEALEGLGYGQAAKRPLQRGEVRARLNEALAGLAGCDIEEADSINQYASERLR